MRLGGMHALVTGGARGTGAEIARLFVEEGAHVVVADVLDDRGGETASAIGATYVHLDVTSEDDWRAAVPEQLDVLVNNAAVLHLATIDLTTAEAFERVLRVNVTGAFLGTKACLPACGRRDAGRSSTSGRSTPCTARRSPPRTRRRSSRYGV